MRGRLTELRRLSLLALAGGAVAATLLPTGVQGASGLPHIRHVWVVMLENQGVGAWTSDPGLAALTGKGAFIANYFGIAHESLPNYIALLSGQGPTEETQTDCQQYRNMVSNSDANYQAQGQGCVYPARVLTLVDQLAGLGLRWKGYMEDMGFDTRDNTVDCNPDSAAANNGSGTPDPTQHGEGPNGTPPNTTVKDQYAVRHDPFMYFHSIIDNHAQCANVVTLQSDNGLYHDLQDISTTPNFSFVTPNLCDDGHDAQGSASSPNGCAAPDAKGNMSSGLAAADDWLSLYIPMILASAAYRQDGMLVLAFDEGPTQDGSSCCNQFGYVNDTGAGPPQATPGPGTSGNGGGQVGAVVLSPFIKPGTTTSNSYNHFSLLRTLEDMFHTVGGSDGNGHIGLARDDPPGTSTKINPGDFGADIFTNPGYVPPPPSTIITLPPPPQVPYLPAPSSPAAPDVHAVVATPTPAPTPAPPDAASPTPTPAHWDPTMLAALPGEGGSAGIIAAFVLVPLLVTGAITFFLRRRGGAS